MRKKNPKKRPLTVIPFAYQDIGYVSVKELLKLKMNIPFIITHKDDPHERIWFRSVSKLAREKKIPVYFAEDLSREGLRDSVEKESPDLIISLYYRKLLPKEVFSIPRMGSINLHGSYLPYYRGRCPVNWVILKGEKFTGLTFHFITEEPDAGDIIRQMKLPITKQDTASSIYRKMTLRAPFLLRKVMEDFMSGKVRRKSQEERKATHFGIRKPEDGEINWQGRAEDIYNLIRAVTHPYPGAFSFLDDKKVFIWNSRVISDSSILKKIDDFACGQIVSISKKKGVIVKAGVGLLGCSRMQLEGLKEEDAYRFAKRYNIKIGDIFLERNPK